MFSVVQRTSSKRMCVVVSRGPAGQMVVEQRVALPQARHATGVRGAARRAACAARRAKVLRAAPLMNIILAGHPCVASLRRGHAFRLCVSSLCWGRAPPCVSSLRTGNAVFLLALRVIRCLRGILAQGACFWFVCVILVLGTCSSLCVILAQGDC